MAARRHATKAEWDQEKNKKKPRQVPHSVKTKQSTRGHVWDLLSPNVYLSDRLQEAQLEGELGEGLGEGVQEAQLHRFWFWSSTPLRWVCPAGLSWWQAKGGPQCWRPSGRTGGGRRWRRAGRGTCRRHADQYLACPAAAGKWTSLPPLPVATRQHLAANVRGWAQLLAATGAEVQSS